MRGRDPGSAGCEREGRPTSHGLHLGGLAPGGKLARIFMPYWTAQQEKVLFVQVKPRNDRDVASAVTRKLSHINTNQSPQHFVNQPTYYSSSLFVFIALIMHASFAAVWPLPKMEWQGPEHKVASVTIYKDACCSIYGLRAQWARMLMLGALCAVIAEAQALMLARILG